MSIRQQSELWIAVCREAGLPPDASIDRVLAAYGGSVGRGTIQRINEGGLPRMSSLEAMAAAINVRVEKFLASPVEQGVEKTRAHAMSYRPHDHPPLMTWESIVRREEPIPERFRCEVPDEALWTAAEGGTARGTPVVFRRTNEAPPPGTGVLVEDSSGHRYIRVYRQAVGGWVAAARNENYLTLHSREHGLKLLAVAENRLLDGQL